jgi:tetratricopeptide (TPR) repeat protein
MRLFGPPNVEQLKANGDVKGLIKALSYKKDAAIRQAAAQALIETDHTQDALSAVLGNAGNEDAREAVVRALDDLGWQPDQDEVGALYWIAKRQWDQCVEIGLSAVDPLIIALQDRDTTVRKAAAEALERIGIAHLSYSEAIEIFEKIAQVLPESGDPYYWLAYIHRQNKQDYEKALRMARKASSIDPKNTKARVEEGKALINLLQFDQALAAFQAAVEGGSRDADCFSYLEVMYRLQGNSNKAMEMQRRHSEVSPGTALAGTVRAKIKQAHYHQLGGASLDEALIHAIVLAKLSLYTEYGRPWGYPNSKWQAFFAPECQFTNRVGEIVLDMPGYYLRLRRFDQSAVTQAFQYMVKQWGSPGDTIIRGVKTILEPYAVRVQPPLPEAYKKIANLR